MAAGDLIYACSAEIGDPAMVFPVVNQTGGTVTHSTTQARPGNARSLRINRTTGSAGGPYCEIKTQTPPFPTGQQQLTFAFRIFPATLPSGKVFVFGVGGGGNDYQLNLSSTGVLTIQVWHETESATVATLSAGRGQTRSSSALTPRPTPMSSAAGSAQGPSKPSPARWRRATSMG